MKPKWVCPNCGHVVVRPRLRREEVEDVLTADWQTTGQIAGRLGYSNENVIGHLKASGRAERDPRRWSPCYWRKRQIA